LEAYQERIDELFDHFECDVLENTQFLCAIPLVIRRTQLLRQLGDVLMQTTFNLLDHAGLEAEND
jgi:hypothetical protein